MSASSIPESMRSLVEQLPFGLDDTERAGATFQRLREATDSGAKEREQERIIDVWTYCFVRRYFTVKFTVNTECPASDLDELVGRAYQKARAKRATVREPGLYAHWVSVVCKNTFLNYTERKRPPDVSLDAEHAPTLPSAERVGTDIGLAHDVVAKAIGRLPEYLQTVARMRLLKGHSYEDISRETDTPVPTARAYAARARGKLRNDPAVRALLDER